MLFKPDTNEKKVHFFFQDTKITSQTQTMDLWKAITDQLGQPDQRWPKRSTVRGHLIKRSERPLPTRGLSLPQRRAAAHHSKALVYQADLPPRREGQGALDELRRCHEQAHRPTSYTSTALRRIIRLAAGGGFIFTARRCHRLPPHLRLAPLHQNF